MESTERDTEETIHDFRKNFMVESKAHEMYALLKESTSQQDIYDMSNEWDQSSEWRCKWCGWEYLEECHDEIPELCSNPECTGHKIRNLLAEIEG